MNFLSMEVALNQICGDVLRPYLRIICLAYSIEIRMSASDAASAPIDGASLAAL